MNKRKNIKTKDVMRTLFMFALLVVFVYYAGHAIGEAISYLAV